MKGFTVMTIIALILLVGGGVTAGLIAATEQASSEPPPPPAILLAEPPQTAPSAETVRPVQLSVAVQKSEADTHDSDQSRGLTAKPTVSGDVDDQIIIPEKTNLNYPNLGSTLDRMAARVEEGEATNEEAAGEAPVHQGESVAVTIYLSENVEEVVSFLEDNGGDPRNVGEDYIEAYVPVSLLGRVSEQPGVLRVREIIPPQPAVSGDVDDQIIIPEKTNLNYPNLGSTLDRMAARVEEGEATNEEAAGEAPVHQGESVAVTIYLSGNVEEVVSFLEDNGGDPRNVGEDYIEAYVPVSLLGRVSEQPGVLRVREIIPPQPAG